MRSTRIQTIVASAGAGKTTRIVGDIAREVERRDPEEIVATTFTVKAADELIERARSFLFKAGKSDAAARLLGARFGTVNAICGQIVAEHAIDLGRSPRVEIIPEDMASRVFAIAADAAIGQHAPALHALAETMGYLERTTERDAERADWRVTVRRMIELARANGIDADGLRQSGKRSVESFLSLLPETSHSGETLDQALLARARAALAAAPAAPSVAGKETLERLRGFVRSVERGDTATWSDWARLSKIGYAKTKDGTDFIDAVDAVRETACKHVQHPRLHAECAEFIRAQFACAADALDAFQTYKAQRGLMDFTDQETLALEALRTPSIAARLGERIGRVFVDEFQDSSPLQIAIFTAMAELVDESTWVGDPKQAIYGFRNADAALTLAAFEGVRAASDEAPDVLSTSWRSRAPIVDFVNAAFGPAFDAMGLKACEHAFTGTGRTDDNFHRSAFVVWRLDGNKEMQIAALAAGIRDAVKDGRDWTVFDKSTKTNRPLRPGDVAVLCRSNNAVREVAAALSALNVKVAVERDRLAHTPHVELVVAALRWVSDPSDRLAMAELARFFADDPRSQKWLEAVSADDQDAALRAAVPVSAELSALRERSLLLTPAELIDALLRIPQMMRRIESWGDVADRLDDLEALRGFARLFEESCASSGSSATPSGLVLALESEEPQRPKSLQANAVAVMTYHAAKGLEWPLVVLSGLATPPRPRLFDVVAETDADLDWRDPLANRWIRYWPWPYGSQKKDVGLDDAALASAVGRAAARRAREEDTRLLYVGVTRARDYLVLAPPAKGELHTLRVLDADRSSHVQIPKEQGGPLIAGASSFDARVVPVAADGAVASAAARAALVHSSRPVRERTPLRRRPSAETASAGYLVAERVELGPRLPIVGAADMTRLGEAVHAIFAADRLGDPQPERLARAEQILARWGALQVDARNVLDACERLDRHIRARWPSARLRRETPIYARMHGQLVSGRIDLLVEHDDGFAIVDHKSFPGSRDTWDARALSYGPQLALYADALAVAARGKAAELFVHMPIVGALLQIARSKGSP